MKRALVATLVAAALVSRGPAEKLGGMDADAAKAWWAFQPLPAAEKDAGPERIDAFLDAALAARGLPAAAAADRRTLLRRVTYDLTGLPPTAEQTDAFLADPAPDAFAKVVDGLLASPQYGVQWGRHWLDVVRYADTAGENTDRPLPHAWRYRNWVIDSFNRDVPYDEFVRLQLAGDLVRAHAAADERREGIVATGYLAIARRFGHDIDKDVHLMHEDVIDTLGKSFLGLTLGCARCHDHKYDPVTAQDYYALSGIFQSTKFSFPGCEPKGRPRDLVPLLTPAENDSLLAPWKAKADALAAEKTRLEAGATAAREALKTLAAGSTRPLVASAVAEGASVPFGVEAPLRVSVRAGEVLQLTVRPNASHGADTTLVEWVISDAATGRQWALADTLDTLLQGNPLASAAGTWCFLDVTDGPKFLHDANAAVNGQASLQKWGAGDLPAVLVNTAAAPVSVWTTLPPRALFVHPGPTQPVAIAWVSPVTTELTLRGRVADAHPAAIDGVSFDVAHLAAPEAGPQLLALGRLPRAAAPDPGPPPNVPVAYAAVEGVVSNARLQQRGDPEKPGEEVPRRWLSVFGGASVAGTEESGRRELAQWITTHPLAARVMVNRVWQWHFGQGLVRTPNDFGTRGEAPTHPELLDWLAARFVADGWSVKKLHRLILGTAAWQRSAAGVTRGNEDPENRFLAHFPRRRLSAEELRDSLLAMSGQLDLTPGEAHPFPPESTWTFTQHGPFNAVYETNRRSAYLMVQRQRRHPFLALFDGADPNASTPQRQVTTAPTQALFFLNDAFFHQQAATVAARAAAVPEGGRVAHLFRHLLQRTPGAEETARAEAFVAAYPGTAEEKWAALCRVMLAGNEFLHLD